VTSYRVIEETPGRETIDHGVIHDDLDPMVHGHRLRADDGRSLTVIAINDWPAAVEASDGMVTLYVEESRIEPEPAKARFSISGLLILLFLTFLIGGLTYVVAGVLAIYWDLTVLDGDTSNPAEGMPQAVATFGAIGGGYVAAVLLVSSKRPMRSRILRALAVVGCAFAVSTAAWFWDVA
jgi:hypothetical protein